MLVHYGGYSATYVGLCSSPRSRYFLFRGHFNHSEGSGKAAAAPPAGVVKPEGVSSHPPRLLPPSDTTAEPQRRHFLIAFGKHLPSVTTFSFRLPCTTKSELESLQL